MVQNNRLFQFFAHAVMILLTLFCALPFFLLIVSSITEETALIQNGYSFLPAKLDFSAYKYLLTNSIAIARGYLITVVVTLVGTTLNLTMTVLMAYPLSRKKLPGRNAFSFLVFFTMLFSGGLVPSYMMWTQFFHVKNTIWALIIPFLMLNAFYIIMMRTFFTTNIPEAILEAAKIDGAGEFTILWKVVLPMSLPIISTVGLFVGLGYWNNWTNGLYFITEDRLFSIQVLLNKMLQDVQYLMSSTASSGSADMAVNLPSTAIKMAVAVLGALPVLVVYPFFQKYFVKGIAIGAVKG